jgi:hypothetical protein
MSRRCAAVVRAADALEHDGRLGDVPFERELDPDIEWGPRGRVHQEVRAELLGQRQAVGFVVRNDDGIDGACCESSDRR